MTPADHPPSCQVCRGSGWQRGPEADVIVDGRVTRHYSTATPCEHHWSNDEPVDETPIRRREYLTRLAPDDPDRIRLEQLDHLWSAP